MKYKPGTFILVPNLQHLAEKPAEMQIIYIWLNTFADKDGKCFPSRTTIARLSGIGLRTVDKYLTKLEEDGFVTKTERSSKTGSQTSNLYQLHLLKDGVQDLLGGSVKNDIPPVSKTAHELYPINNTQLTKEADASTVVETNKEDMKFTSRSTKEVLISDVYKLWISMASAALGMPDKDIEKKKLMYSISSAISREEEWKIADFKDLFKYFFADEAMKFENKLSYAICLSSTYVAKYKLAKKGKAKSTAFVSGDIRL
jgi:GntR family transcriptional regulator